MESSADMMSFSENYVTALMVSVFPSPVALTIPGIFSLSDSNVDNKVACPSEEAILTGTIPEHVVDDDAASIRSSQHLEQLYLACAA